MIKASTTTITVANPEAMANSCPLVRAFFRAGAAAGTMPRATPPGVRGPPAPRALPIPAATTAAATAGRPGVKEPDGDGRAGAAARATGAATGMGG